MNMKEACEVKEGAGMFTKLTELFGVSREFFEATYEDVRDSYAMIAGERSSETEKCVRFLEETLKITEYDSEQLLRFVILFREFYTQAKMEGKDQALAAIAILIR